MSESAQQAAHASARLKDPSRRFVLTSGVALPLLGTSNDPAVDLCETWLERNAEHERLGRRWQDIESRMFAEHNWAKLSRIERAQHHEQYEMDALYDRMDELHTLNQTLLASLPTIVATTRFGICGKLAVAAIEACPEEHPQLHQLISSILRDYRALHGA